MEPDRDREESACTARRDEADEDSVVAHQHTSKPSKAASGRASNMIHTSRACVARAGVRALHRKGRPTEILAKKGREDPSMFKKRPRSEKLSQTQPASAKVHEIWSKSAADVSQGHFRECVERFRSWRPATGAAELVLQPRGGPRLSRIQLPPGITRSAELTVCIYRNSAPPAPDARLCARAHGRAP